MAVVKVKSKLADSNGLAQIVDGQTHVADASVAHALNSSFSDVEAEAALNALGGKINSIFLILEAHGLMKES